MTEELQNNYIIATIKSWNVDRFEEISRQVPGNWFLIEDPEELTLGEMDDINPRYIFLPHWSWKIPAEVYEKYECVIFHETDLPYGRGGSPIQNLIEQGVRKTKITALRAVKEMDAGPIYMKRDLFISSGSIQEILSYASFIIKYMIEQIVDEEPIPVPQVGKPTVFKRRTPDQSILPVEWDPRKLFDHIRMLDGEGYPRAFVDVGDLRIHFYHAGVRIGDDDNSVVSAKVRITKRGES